MGKSSLSLEKYLKNATEKVRETAANSLNECATMLVNDIKTNMAEKGINEDTGQLRGSVGFENKATPKKVAIVIKSEVFKPAPKRPGSRNPAMRGRYKYGVPYGRIIEFSPRINKPFFYTAWYENRNSIKQKVMEDIGNAWSRG